MKEAYPFLVSIAGILLFFGFISLIEWWEKKKGANSNRNIPYDP